MKSGSYIKTLFLMVVVVAAGATYSFGQSNAPVIHENDPVNSENPTLAAEDKKTGEVKAIEEKEQVKTEEEKKAKLSEPIQEEPLIRKPKQTMLRAVVEDSKASSKPDKRAKSKIRTEPKLNK